jgi:beta-galactosidase
VLKSDGDPSTTGQFTVDGLAPGQSCEIELPAWKWDPRPGGEYLLDIEFRLQKENSWASQGHLLAQQQFEMPKIPATVRQAQAPVENVKEADDEITVTTSGMQVVFDKKKGTMSGLSYRGVDLIAGGPRPDFWRAPIDNDRGNKMPQRCGVWRDAGKHWQITNVRVSRRSPGEVQIIVEGQLPDVAANYNVEYSVKSTPSVLVQASYQASKKKLPEMPRFGMQLVLPAGFTQMKWYGRGPQESYWDRKDGYPVGIYRSTVDDEFVDYSRPQENGNKTDVRWMQLTNRTGFGIEFKGVPVLSAAARHFSAADLEAAGHTFELERRDEVYVNVDHKQMGVGGDNSWGARPHPQYQLTEKSYRYSFVIRPIAPSE